MDGTIDVMDKPNEPKNIPFTAQINLFEALSLFIIFVMIIFLMIRRLNNKSSCINPLDQNLVSSPGSNIDQGPQIYNKPMYLLQTQSAKPNQEKFSSDHRENSLMESHMPLVVSPEDGRRILVDATDPENITDRLLSDSRCNNPTITSLANIYEEAADRYFARIREINPEEEFNAIQCVIDDEVLFANSSLNPRLTHDAANIIADKIRRTKSIPTFIPSGIMDHYDCDNWRKAFWYAPLVMTAYQFVSPLVIEQNGLWAITVPGGEFELVARFEDYEIFDLQNFSPERVIDAILAEGNISSDEQVAKIDDRWLCFSLGDDVHGAKKYAISFHEYVPEDDLGNHLIVIKAMIDVWFLYVIASKGAPAFHFDLCIFKDFDRLDSVIDWAISEDTVEEKEFAASANPSVSTSTIMQSEIDLLENPEFRQLVSIAKRIAQRSGKTELTPLLLLCGLATIDDLSVKLTLENISIIKELARQKGISFDEPGGGGLETKMPVGDTLKTLIAAHKKSSLSVFSLALLKTIS